ncbi:3-hydroxyisobutyryl-CoA hydrolase [Janibacter terrae]|jgi:enoyl-CoA hydratase|uniref:3-hydroxyisobutyryl-CoA hydrolase n=1 Tax=Janibacter terrae TaxID=103817 RepID=A0ABZ2F9F9_9MICO|nr:3-hydroxyisobutyryl-CoA hydrolase [Janibacter terrae]MBA4085052.1 3-hydroxyisobutyryl-CoA hydrolase [Kytococcus sp.]HBO53918.1 3-hydroxyisobutyryl-CoA hydrolase [Janibacter terrae]
MADFTPGTTGTDEVLFAVDGSLGRVLLNRPRAINALTREMVVAMQTRLAAWADDDAVTAISLEGAGERGFCAGGDVRAVREAHLTGTSGGVDFWADEYALDAQIAEYPKPVVAVMDGIVMGGGLGLSMFATARWTTERSRIAMPETIIGFFPDVAATYLLSRAPGEVGTHMALTGATVTGADAVHVGLADAVVDHTRLPELIAAVAGGGPIEPVPAGAMTKGGDLASSHGWVDECYAGDDAAVILARLREHADPAARAAAEEISLRSPLSVAVTLAALRRAATAGSVREVLEADTRISRGLLARADFVEGVRALLVDKDRQPRWEHADVDEVTRSEVMSVLEG